MAIKMQAPPAWGLLPHDVSGIAGPATAQIVGAWLVLLAAAGGRHDGFFGAPM